MENVFRFCLFQFGQICQYDKYICAVISLQSLLNLTLYIMIPPPHTHLLIYVLYSLRGAGAYRRSHRVRGRVGTE